MKKNFAVLRDRISLFKFPLLAIAALVAAFIFTQFFFSFAFVYGNSMEPGYKDGDTVVLDKRTASIQQLERQDVIVFKNKNISEHPIIKRIAAIPGDTVEIKNGRLIINEAEVKLYGQPLDEGENMEKTVILQDQYFVIGDNPSSSVDSRSPEFGTVSRSDVMGKVIFTVFSR